MPPTDPASVCPVDHTARAAWLEQVRLAQKDSSSSPSRPTAGDGLVNANNTTAAAPAPKLAVASPLSSASASAPATAPDKPATIQTRPLSLDRETSTIPRAASPSSVFTSPSPYTFPSPSTSTSPSSTCSPSPVNITQPTTDPSSDPSNTISGCPVRHEDANTGNGRPGNHTKGAGNWIYPSEKMFFEAMRRKNYTPHATDMAAIVPIHNAVNERAWAEIRQWESRFPWVRAANARCGGPRLRSFAGDATRLSPRARWNGLLGYKAPFDRHDWVVERCPENPGVEYVIDFYEGRSTSQKNPNNGKVNGSPPAINFYLDVRPKLNTWEGWKMRIASLLGIY